MLHIGWTERKIKEKRTIMNVIKQRSGKQLEHFLKHNHFLTIIIEGHVNSYIGKSRSKKMCITETMELVGYESYSNIERQAGEKREQGKIFATSRSLYKKEERCVLKRNYRCDVELNVL